MCITMWVTTAVWGFWVRTYPILMMELPICQRGQSLGTADASDDGRRDRHEDLSEMRRRIWRAKSSTETSTGAENRNGATASRFIEKK
jgi:hypothetical protein